jgi:endonuclease-8
MPEGDTIFRIARAMQRALQGRTVIRVESALPSLARAPGAASLEGRVVEGVTARGKHLLISFSDGWVLRTHLRLHGSWHLYRTGDRWKRPRRNMRIVLTTPDVEAVAFDVPDAEILRTRDLARHASLTALGPDPLSPDFDASEAARRLRAHPERGIAEALLDQRSIAGIGNVIKSEVLFVCRVNPFVPTGTLNEATIEKLIDQSRRLMRISVAEGGVGRRTTGRIQPGARLWVYARAGRPCRVCGTPVRYSKQGTDMRSTYWCPSCQA